MNAVCKQLTDTDVKVKRQQEKLELIARNIASSPGRVVEESAAVGKALLRLDEQDMKVIPALRAEIARLKSERDAAQNSLRAWLKAASSDEGVGEHNIAKLVVASEAALYGEKK